MHDRQSAGEPGMSLRSLAGRWSPPQRLTAFTELLGVVATATPRDTTDTYDVHVRLIAGMAAGVMLEPAGKAPARFGQVDPVTGRWFHGVGPGSYRVLVFGPGIRAVDPTQQIDGESLASMVRMGPPVAMETALPAAAAGGDEHPRWHRLYRDADGAVEVELVESEQSATRLTIAARSQDASDTLSMVRVSLDAGATAYLIPLAASDRDCRGEITVELPPVVSPTVEAGLWSFDLRPGDRDCIIRSVEATRPRGRTRRTWALVAEHATRNGIEAVAAAVRAGLARQGATNRGDGDPP